MIVSALNIKFSPLMPPSFLLLALFLALLLFLAGWRAGQKGAFLRLLAAVFLLLALINPALVREQRKPVPDVALVVLDASPSMEIAGRKKQGEEAFEAVRERLSHIPQLETRFITYDPGIMAPDTKLFETISQAMSDIPRERRAGVIMVTDGRVHDVPELADAWGPLHALLAGSRKSFDRRLIVRNAPTWGLVGKPVSFEAEIVDDGDVPDERPGEIVVTLDGGVISRMPASPGNPVSITLPAIDHAGANIVELSVDTVPGELTEVNNKTAFFINGVRDRLKVLLISGSPYAGGRTWRNFLKADPGIDLVHFTILRSPETWDMTPQSELSLIAFPVHELFEEKIGEFDLIIFDRYEQRGVLLPSYFENIVRFVENGGALLEANGPGFTTEDTSVYFTALKKILPGKPTGGISQEGFLPRITDTGKKHPVTAGLGPISGRWFRQIDVQPAPDARVLMSGDHDRPLLMLQQAGKGRVAQLASDQIWLWSRGFEGGGPYYELLRRLAHWLMREPELEEEILKAQAAGQNIRVQRRSLSDSVRSVTMISPGGQTDAVELTPQADGWFSADIKADTPGLYKFDDGQKTAFAVAGDFNSAEMKELLTTDTLLAPAIRKSGGSAQWLSDGALPDIRHVAGGSYKGFGWMGLRKNDQYILQGIAEYPLLPVFALLGLCLGGIVAAWWREGQR